MDRIGIVTKFLLTLKDIDRRGIFILGIVCQTFDRGDGEIVGIQGKIFICQPDRAVIVPAREENPRGFTHYAFIQWFKRQSKTIVRQRRVQHISLIERVPHQRGDCRYRVKLQHRLPGLSALGESLHPVESLHLLDFVQDVPRELGCQQEICPSSGLVVPVLEMTVRQLGQNLLIETVRSDESGQPLDRLVNFEYTLEVPGLTQGRVPV